MVPVSVQGVVVKAHDDDDACGRGEVAPVSVQGVEVGVEDAGEGQVLAKCEAGRYRCMYGNQRNH